MTPHRHEKEYMMENYKIMHKNDIVAETEGLTVTRLVIPSLCPAMARESSCIAPWIALRSVDVHRSSSRHLFNALRLAADATAEDKIRAGHAVTIEDNWWVQREDEDCSYERLKAYNKTAADIAAGEARHITIESEGYTELGTLGSFEKAWRKINGAWFLHKKGDTAELLSEYFSYNFLKCMGVDVADYSVYRYTPKSGIEKTMVLSKDFTLGGEYDFEPFACYFGENEDYRYILEKLGRMEDSVPGVTEDYVRMCFFDGLLNNGDRHNGNAGFLRDAGSGRLLRLAPLYDYNQALIALDGDLAITENRKGYMGHFMAAMPAEYTETIDYDAETIARAVKYAQGKTLEQFPGSGTACRMCGQYIEDAFRLFLRSRVRRAGIPERDKDMEI